MSFGIRLLNSETLSVNWRSGEPTIGLPTLAYMTRFVSLHLGGKQTLISTTQILGVLNGFETALDNAIALDNQILHDGSQISTNYYDLLALTTRQAMGAIDITVGQDSAGNLNASDIKAFMRGAGGIGSGGYVSNLSFQFPDTYQSVQSKLC